MTATTKYKGWTIFFNSDTNRWDLYTPSEPEQFILFTNPKWEAITVDQAIQFIDDYSPEQEELAKTLEFEKQVLTGAQAYAWGRVRGLYEKHPDGSYSVLKFEDYFIKDGIILARDEWDSGKILRENKSYTFYTPKPRTV